MTDAPKSDTMKPGIKTSEFWISLVVTLLGALLASGVLGAGEVSQIAGAVLSSMGSLGYGVSRGLAKKA